MTDNLDILQTSEDAPDFQINVLPSTSRRKRESSCGNRTLFSGHYWREIKELFTLAWPTVLSYFLFHLVFMITMFFAGQLGKDELATATLAVSFINVTGASMFIGLASAVETLCSQAFGAKNYRLVGVVLQRGVCILGIACIFLSQEFVLICIPGGVGMFFYALLQRYLQTQGIVRPILYVGAVTNVILIGLNALMLFGFKWNFSAVAVCWVISMGIMPALLLLYLKVFKLDKLSWPGWTIESLLDWGEFFKLAISGMAMLCIEWWSFEVGAFVTGAIVCYSLIAVLAIYKKYIRIVSFFYLFDGIQGVCSGVVRGSGRQRIGVAINFLAFCCLGLPLGVTLTFFVFHEALGESTDESNIGSIAVKILKAQRRTAVKSVTKPSSDGVVNGDCSKLKENNDKEEKEILISSWINKSSSLPFLDRFSKRDDSPLRLNLLPEDVNSSLDDRVHSVEKQAMDGSEMGITSIKRSHGLTPSEKKTLIAKRLIPLVLSLLVLGGAVAIHFLIPLPSSREMMGLMANDTIRNSTYNFTLESPT
ncbi:Multidrug and toxin extrusion protein 2 [Acropora cervicornis]|uniref:Multidrug and toxin extrusion protein n=1 Tax=Acropora cervicornis TaxID=6130 RepID=A0AAD9V3Q5_ACRCE|nr:Multidrug and toxin extrusion protein 2 [Acropora cervicornis]